MTTTGAPAGLLAASTGMVPVLCTTLAVSGELDELPALPPPDKLTTTRNCVYVNSVLAAHIATVTLQHWPGEPPPPAADERWEVVNTATVDLAGEVTGVTITDGEPEGPELDFPPGTYHLRAYARGRARLLSLISEHPEDEQLLRDGTEEHLLQFWPA